MRPTGWHADLALGHVISRRTLRCSRAGAAKFSSFPSWPPPRRLIAGVRRLRCDLGLERDCMQLTVTSILTLLILFSPSCSSPGTFREFTVVTSEQLRE